MSVLAKGRHLKDGTPFVELVIGDDSAVFFKGDGNCMKGWLLDNNVAQHTIDMILKTDFGVELWT